MSGRERTAPASASSPEPASLASPEPPKPEVKRNRRARSLLLAALPLLLAVFVYYVPSIMDEYQAYFGYGSAPMYELPAGVMDVFRVYDADGDGYIDPYEFVVLGMRLREQVREGGREGGRERGREREREGYTATEGAGEGGREGAREGGLHCN